MTITEQMLVDLIGSLEAMKSDCELAVALAKENKVETDVSFIKGKAAGFNDIIYLLKQFQD